MSHGQSLPPLSPQILEEACDWFIEFNEGELNASARAEFNQWLRRSPEHVRAYVEIAAAWEESARLSSRRTLGSDELVARALADHNVVALASQVAASARPDGVPADRPSRSYRYRLAVAATLLITIAGIGAWYAQGRDIYSTDVGEQRTLQLADGSTVELNSRSKLRIRLSPGERSVDLLNGEALFEVAKDAKRPFVVYSDRTRVRAVGTQFDVYRKPSATTVTVVEGRVAVAAPALSAEESGTGAKPAEDVLISAGEQVTVAPHAPIHPARANVASVTAWTQRKLVFDDSSLTDVINEFNRYNPRRIVLDDPQLEEFHIRGTFLATDPGRFVEFLRHRFDVEVTEAGSEIRISQKINPQTR
jgi:transmembrane sensor